MVHHLIPRLYFSSLLLLLLLLRPINGSDITSTYIVGPVGISCTQTCYQKNLNCNPGINTQNSAYIFTQLGFNCVRNDTPWNDPSQPGINSGSGECVGYMQVPGGVLCSGWAPFIQRLCRCDSPNPDVLHFGDGLSNGEMDSNEKYMFSHTLYPGQTGIMNHLWVTYGASEDQGVIIRYYIDKEQTASIVIEPSLACGVGFYDKQGPWGNRWIGKGALDGAWFFNLKIPFTNSVLVTVQHINPNGTYNNFYMIVRGAANVPIVIGDVPIPSYAKLNLFTVNALFNPLDWITLANVPQGQGIKGFIFLHSLQVLSGNWNFLEGCYHTYTNNQDFPGTLLSTGTEDYFDSAWYFNGGEFHLPVAGFTHQSQSGGNLQWSAYRFHEMDPIIFNDGIQFVWRNGDTLDPSGIKCMMQTGGQTVGSPTQSQVLSYVWIYTWT